MLDDRPSGFLTALEDFRRARRDAAMEAIISRFTGRSAELLSFDAVRQQLKGTVSEPAGLQDIPLDAIVGSVGRYTDFSRTFLPRRESDKERWARVRVVVEGLGNFPPIEVYQIGDAYFVLDGNHRVSVMRKQGAKSIHAYVSKVRTRIPLSPDVQPDELILLAEYTEFLERTRLDITRPNPHLTVTAPGRYRILEEQIAAQQFLLAQAQGHEVSFDDAATDWYDSVYLPVVQFIHERGILDEFPGRTETDLYVWISQHREQLTSELGWEVAPEAAAADLSEQHSPRPDRIVARVGGKILGALTPGEAEPETGAWRRGRVAQRDKLFADSLVAITGEADGWQVLDQAILIAQREGGRLLGLHVEPSGAKADSYQSQIARSEFEHRCEAAGVAGQFVVDVGPIAPTICGRARWADLVVAPLHHPPSAQPIARLRSGFRTLIRSCSRPILAVPSPRSRLERALLAYDGSAKADEALYVATYLAARWKIALVVLTVTTEEHAPSPAQARAQHYLAEQGVSATFAEERGLVFEAILRCASEHATDFTIMGGYGQNVMREMVLGSTVDEVLRTSEHPTLICR